MASWTRCGGAAAGPAPNPITRREAKALARGARFQASPAMRVLASRSAIVARLPDALLAIVSRFLSLVPEARLLLALVAAGRVPNHLLVEMTRVSCAARRLAWDASKGRFACTTKQCHRQHCRWRRGNRACATAHCGYTRSAFLKRLYAVRGAPRGCWDVKVDGHPMPYVLTVLERIGERWRDSARGEPTIA